MFSKFNIAKIFFVVCLISSVVFLSTQFNPNREKIRSFKNIADMTLIMITTDNKELHSLYKRPALNTSKIARMNSKENFFEFNKPYQFYLSEEEVKPTNFLQFIAETDFTFDYYFDKSSDAEANEDSITVSRQDALSLANWLSDKERVSYQIIDNKEVEKACFNIAEKSKDITFFPSNSDIAERICHKTKASSYQDVAEANGHRLNREIN